MTDLQKEFYPNGLIVILIDTKTFGGNTLKKGEVFEVTYRGPTGNITGKSLSTGVFCSLSKSLKSVLWKYL